MSSDVDLEVCALCGRAQVRDYVDVDAIVVSSRYTEEQLLDLAADHDSGFDLSSFAEALASTAFRTACSGRTG